MALVFWIIMIVWAVLGVWATRTNRDYFALSNAALIWILFAILGYAVFGFGSLK